MRAITGITIQKKENETRVNMFCTYNNDSNDYGFNPYNSIEEALDSLPKNDPYFPIKTNTYKLIIFGETKIEETKAL